jgi:hypothetical protein
MRRSREEWRKGRKEEGGMENQTTFFLFSIFHSSLLTSHI